LFLWWQSRIFSVFSVTWCFWNLIGCSRNISYYYQCWKQSCCWIFVWIQDSLMNIKFKITSFIWNWNLLENYKCLYCHFWFWIYFNNHLYVVIQYIYICIYSIYTNYLILNRLSMAARFVCLIHVFFRKYKKYSFASHCFFHIEWRNIKSKLLTLTSGDWKAEMHFNMEFSLVVLPHWANSFTLIRGL